MSTGTLSLWGHRACRDTKHTGTPSVQGRRVCRDTELTGFRSQTLSGLSKPNAGQAGTGKQGVTAPVAHAGAGSALHWPGLHPAGSAAGAGRAALSQAGSPDPLNHWKIRQGSVTRDGSIPQCWSPRGHPSVPEHAAPRGTGAAKTWGRMWESCQERCRAVLRLSSGTGTAWSSWQAEVMGSASSALASSNVRA